MFAPRPYFFCVLLISFPVFSKGSSPRADSKNALPSFDVAECDCSNLENCLPFCRKLCAMNANFSNISNYLHQNRKEKCEKILKENSVFSNTVTLSNIETVVKRIKKQVSEQESQKVQINEGECKGCYQSAHTQIHIKPLAFKTNSCDKKYIKTHHFRRAFKIQSKKCDKKDLDSIHFKISQYSQSILSNSHPDARQMWERCPSQCSFYITYGIHKQLEPCQGVLDLNIHCGDAKISSGFFGKDTKYSVKADNKMQIKCNKEGER